MNPFVQDMTRKRERSRRVATLKRVLRILHVTDVRHRSGQTLEKYDADIATLESMIEELGGDARTGAHAAIKEGNERSE